MKREIIFRRTLALFLACSLGLAGRGSLLCAQERTPTDSQSGLSVGVLVDTSAHQENVIEFEREMIRALADGFAGVVTESFVIRYADEVETLQEWSPFDSGLTSASTRIELDTESEKNRRTLLYDALNVALTKLDTRNSTNSKILIVVAEGNDAGSVMKYSQIKKRAQSAHVQCFVLLVADHNLMGGRVRHFGFDLYDLASATKGKAYDIERSRKNLDKAIGDVLKRVH